MKERALHWSGGTGCYTMKAWTLATPRPHSSCNSPVRVVAAQVSADSQVVAVPLAQNTQVYFVIIKKPPFSWFRKLPLLEVSPGGEHTSWVPHQVNDVTVGSAILQDAQSHSKLCRHHPHQPEARRPAQGVDERPVPTQFGEQAAQPPNAEVIYVWSVDPLGQVVWVSRNPASKQILQQADGGVKALFLDAESQRFLRAEGARLSSEQLLCHTWTGAHHRPQHHRGNAHAAAPRPSVSDTMLSHYQQQQQQHNDGKQGHRQLVTAEDSLVQSPKHC